MLNWKSRKVFASESHTLDDVKTRMQHMLLKCKGLFPYYVISYNKQGSFQMITKDYSKGPRVVGKDYVLWKIQSMQESATMPHAHVFCCTPQCWDNAWSGGVVENSMGWDWG